MALKKILGYLEKKLPSDESVENYMRKTVATVAPDQSVGETVDVIFQYNVHGVIVCDEEGAPLGVFSGFDALTLLAKRAFDYEQPVKDVMTSPAVTVEAAADIRKAMKVMLANGFKRLPVVTDGKVVGLLAIADVAAAMIAEQDE